MAPNDIPTTDADTPEEGLDFRELVRQCVAENDEARDYNRQRKANMTPQEIEAEEEAKRREPIDLALRRRLKKLGDINASTSPWLERLCWELGGEDEIQRDLKKRRDQSKTKETSES